MPLMGLLHWLQSGGVRISDRIGSEVETLTEDGFHFTKVFVQWRSCANDVLCHRFVTFFQIQVRGCRDLICKSGSPQLDLEQRQSHYTISL